MSLVDFIRNGNYASSQEAYAALVTPVETLNDKAWTVADLARLFPDDINTILSTLKSVPVFESAFIALSITGLELASDERQVFITEAAQVGNWSAELTEQIKQLGRTSSAPWQSMGLSQEPTLSEVEEAYSIVNAEPDVWSHEVLLSVNRQADGTMQVFARVTPVGLKDGQIIQRGEAQVHVNSDLVAAVSPIVEGLING
jgi:hypothetical protein